MTDLDLTLLRAFLSLAEELNFTRAARSLFISQPSLSNQIRRLEQQVGAPLFDRTSRRVQLTPAGLRFYPAATDIVASVSRAIAVARGDGDGTPTLRVGHVGCGGADLLHPVGIRIQRDTGARLIPHALEFGTLLAALVDEDGGVDAAFLHLPYAPADLAGIELTPVRAERRIVLLPAEHPLSNREVLHPRDVADETFVGLDTASSPVWRAFWLLHHERAGRGHDLEPPLMARNTEDLLGLVAATGALATAPSSLEAVYRHPGVVCRRLVGTVPATLALAWPSRRTSPLVRPLLSAVRRFRSGGERGCLPSTLRSTGAGAGAAAGRRVEHAGPVPDPNLGRPDSSRAG